MPPLIEALPFDDALALGMAGERPAEAWIVSLLECTDIQAPRLFRAANEVRRHTMGDAVHLRALIEFSNHCRKNCEYCGIRNGNQGIARYRLTHDEIVATARQAFNLGYQTTVLQSGEDFWYTRDRMAEIIRDIKATTGLAITLSVGERDTDTYRAWHEAGADRFLLRIETTDPEIFARLHPDDDLNTRKACLVTLRDLGFQLGSGVMVGLPGQTAATLARDVIWMHGLGVEMIGIGPFLPHPATPLADAPAGTLDQTLRLVSVLRLAFPTAHIPATTAMGTIAPGGRERALMAGANVVMPNVTPSDRRAKYELYPNKICIDDTADACRQCIEARIRALGRTIATDAGHVASHQGGTSS